MTDPAQIPHLLKLLDDESPSVQRAVARALATFGPGLAQVLAQLPDPPDALQMRRIDELIQQTGRVEREDGEAIPVVQFEIGQLVRHRRYRYRGVVVSADPTCQADDEWYFANRTQPDRDQPWYHVLVHDSEAVTYAARSSLEADDSGEQVTHPLLPHFFEAFDEGQYIRNNREWPPT